MADPVKTPIDMMLDRLEWKPVDPPADTTDGLSYATHEGRLTIGNSVLDCYVLNTGERIITEESINRFFGFIEDNAREE